MNRCCRRFMVTLLLTNVNSQQFSVKKPSLNLLSFLIVIHILKCTVWWFMFNDWRWEEALGVWEQISGACFRPSWRNISGFGERVGLFWAELVREQREEGSVVSCLFVGGVGNFSSNDLSWYKRRAYHHSRSLPHTHRSSVSTLVWECHRNAWLRLWSLLFHTVRVQLRSLMPGCQVRRWSLFWPLQRLSPHNNDELYSAWAQLVVHGTGDTEIREDSEDHTNLWTFQK